MAAKPTMESWANLFIKKYHGGYQLNVERDIELIPYSVCFLLKIHDTAGAVRKVYLIQPMDRLIAETSQPFYEKLATYFKGIETTPHMNYAVGYLEVDDTGHPLGETQVFSLPEAYRRL
ncbi:MAG: hypothetical protein EOP04_01790 [Proteobacteria bacterium]|nr:MAG: hypothetical protein EOP04_01790 [Pseudomonadota bacterium]